MDRISAAIDRQREWASDSFHSQKCEKHNFVALFQLLCHFYFGFYPELQGGWRFLASTSTASVVGEGTNYTFTLSSLLAAAKVLNDGLMAKNVCGPPEMQIIATDKDKNNTILFAGNPVDPLSSWKLDF